MYAVAETTNIVGLADLARRMDTVDHVLEIDGCVVGTQTGQTRVGAALVDVCHHRIVASNADLGFIGPVVAVQRKLVMALIALLYVNN